MVTKIVSVQGILFYKYSMEKLLRCNKKFSLIRQVLGEEDEKQSSGKIFKKLRLGDYEWMNYRDADDIVTKFGAGLISLGLQPRDTVSIYAETRQVRDYKVLLTMNDNDDVIIHRNGSSVLSVLSDKILQFQHFTPTLEMRPYVTASRRLRSVL